MEPSELVSPGVRHACARGLTWTLCLVGVTCAIQMNARGAPSLLVLAGPALFGLVVSAPTGWLEAHARARPDSLLRGFVALACAPPLLAGVVHLQVVYLEAVLRLGPQQALVELVQTSGDGLRTFVVGGVWSGVPVAIAASRRVARLPFGRVAVWQLLLSVALCGLWAPFLLLWLAVEMVDGLADEGERAWLAARAPRGALQGLLPSRVWLLAYLGHPEAQRLLGARAPVAPDALSEWLSGLEPAGSEALLRGAAATVRRVLREAPPPAGWELAWAALGAWSEAPTAERSGAAREALLAAPAPGDGREVGLRMLVGVLHPEPWGRVTSFARALPALGEPEVVRAEIEAELREWALEGTLPPTVG